MRLLLPLLFALSAVVSAQQPPRDGAVAVPPTGTGSITGVVRNDIGEAVRRAVVTTSGGLTTSAITDDQGRFVLSGLPAGRFTVTARKPGFAAMSYGASRPNRPGVPVIVTEGQATSALTVTLPRGVVLAGTVYDERGQPLPGVGLMAWEVRESLGGARTLASPATGGIPTMTDDTGAYRIYGLPAGEYTVGTFWAFSGSTGGARIPTDAEIREAFRSTTTAAPGRTSGAAVAAPDTRRYNYAPTYLPDSTDPMAATTVRVAQGETRDGLDLRMPLRVMTVLTGTVSGGDPDTRVSMSLTRRSRVEALNSSRVWSSEPDGTFSATDLSPADYTLFARLQATPSRPALVAVQDLTIGDAAEIKVALSLEPAPVLKGRVQFEGTPPTPLDIARATVTLVPEVRAAGINSPTTVLPTGDLSITDVAPGRARITATMPPPAGNVPRWMLKTVHANDSDVTDVFFDVPAGAPPTVTVTFTDKVSELTGRVTDTAGQAVADYFIIVIPADAKYWISGSRRIASARPGSDGAFAFRNLPPGDYRIAATTDLAGGDLADRAALTRLLGESAPVTIAPGEQKVFDIRLARERQGTP
jgi:protocatechuate 3,4-dioxygenase beta subunit